MTDYGDHEYLYEVIVADRQERREERYLERMDRRWGRVEDWRAVEKVPDD